VRSGIARTLAFVIFAAAVSPAAARAVGHERIPLENWSYRAVERFEALGACTLAEDRPFSRDEFIRIVETIAAWAKNTTLSPRDAYQLDRLEREFTTAAARSDPRERYDRALYHADSLVAMEADFDAYGFAERVPFGDETQYYIGSNPTAKIHVGGRVTYDVRYRLLFGPEDGQRADDQKPSRRTRSFNGLTSLFDRSYVLATWQPIDLIAGRDYVSWGPSGLAGSLVTPGDRYSIDQLGLRLRFGPVRLDAFTGQLFGAPERWMVGHRLEATLGRTVVGLTETVVYNSRGFDMLYMLPLAWFYANQYNERTNDDNILWSVDAKTHVVDGVTVYGSFLVDDFQFEREEGNPDKLAFDVGFRWVPARPLGLSISGEYRWVDIYTYSHVDSLSIYVSGAGKLEEGDVLLGGAPSPDTDAWRLDVDVYPRANLSVTAGVFGRRAGEGRDIRGFQTGDDKNPPFPSGIVDELVGFNLGAKYELAGDSWVALTYAHASATNRDNVAGNDPVTDAFRVEIRWDIP